MKVGACVDGYFECSEGFLLQVGERGNILDLKYPEFVAHGDE